MGLKLYFGLLTFDISMRHSIGDFKKMVVGHSTGKGQGKKWDCEIKNWES